MNPSTLIDRLIKAAATKQVDGEGFRVRMERWLSVKPPKVLPDYSGKVRQPVWFTQRYR